MRLRSGAAERRNPRYPSERYYVGDFRKDALTEGRNGWFVGFFMPDGVRRTNRVEVKYWEFPEGPTGHATKTESKMVECTLLLRGRAQGRIDGRRVVLSAGQYFVIAPGVVSNIPERIQSKGASFLVIKAPSVRRSKILIEAHKPT